MPNNGQATVLAAEKKPPFPFEAHGPKPGKEAHSLMGNDRAGTKTADTSSNVIQVPTWAITAFAVPAILLVVWLTSFWTSTNYQLETLKDANEELRKDVRLQDAWLRETRELMIKNGMPASNIPTVPDISRPREGAK